MTSYIKTDTHLSIVFDNGEPATIYTTNPNFNNVCDAIKENDWETVYDLAFPREQMKREISGLGNDIQIQDGVVMYNDTPVHNSLTKRMIQMHNEGFNIAPMAEFLKNLLDNPSYRAVNELYTFLESSNLPITEDGHFLAYKRVDDRFRDIYTRRIDNSPGVVVEMPRNKVNEDQNQTCSAGLHFCSREYLPHYGARDSTKVVLIKINPRDVVAIPADYNNAKGRCCRYEVLRELVVDKESESRDYMPEEIEGCFTDVKTIGDLIREQVSFKRPTGAGILQMYDGNIIASFQSSTEANQVTGIDASSITKVCNGERYTAGGYQWAYDAPTN